MALQIWCPFTSDTKQQGLQDTAISISATQGSIVTNGKLGKCLKTESQTIDLNYIPDINNSSISMGGWFKFNKAEIQAVITTKANITETSAECTGNIIGNNAYGGLGLIYNTNNLYISNKELTSISIFPYLRTSTVGKTTASFFVTFDTWYHIFLVWDKENQKLKLYRNGILYSEDSVNTFSDAVSRSLSFNSNRVGGGNGPGLSIPFYSNDIRVYDSCLSDREIEILSRGLVCHYPLCDISNQTINNVATAPTFNTSAATGAWAHWGASGSSGEYGQTTDKQYIYHKENTYAHWVSNASTATNYYILYQSPDFSGGYRSMCAIIKEENSAQITESIVYPGWNAPIGSHPLHKWDSITSLGDGFYLCKVEGFQQDGSNNLVCIHVPPGNKVYVSEMYIENDRAKCSDILYPSTTVYDTSGYQYNGTVNGSLTVSNDTARYSVSTYIPQAGYIQHPNALGSDTMNQEWTCCAWVKLDNTSANQQLNNFNMGNNIVHSSNSVPLLYVNSGSHDYYRYGSVAVSANVWTHVAFVFKNSDGTRNIYINGVLTNNTTQQNKDSTPLGIPDNVHVGSGNFAGYVSDYREYATALSAEQVAELYNTAVSVANNGTLMGYELVEV